MKLGGELGGQGSSLGVWGKWGADPLANCLSIQSRNQRAGGKQELEKDYWCERVGVMGFVASQVTELLPSHSSWLKLFSSPLDPIPAPLTSLPQLQGND